MANPLTIQDIIETKGLVTGTKARFVIKQGEQLQGIPASNVGLTGSSNTWTGTNTFGAITATTGTFSGLLTLTGGQIRFPSTQVPSADANTLDDYEEGTFTPGMTFGGSATGVTFNTVEGFYTKIGRLVVFKVNIDINSNGTGVGAAVVTGLPFTVSAANGTAFFGTGSGFSGLTGSVTGFVSGTTIALRQWGATGVSNLTDTIVPNSCSFTCNGVYFV